MLITPIAEAGQANEASAPRSLQFIVMNAPPKALRRITVSRGTVAAERTQQARTVSDDAARSWRVPGMNPGVSTGQPAVCRTTRRSTNFAPFWEASASITPPRWLGWFATTPIEPLEASEAHDHVPRPAAPDLQEAPAVDDALDH